MNYLGLVVFLLFSPGSGVFVVWIYLPVGAGIGRRVFTDRVMVCYPRTYKCDRLAGSWRICPAHQHVSASNPSQVFN